MNNSSNSISVNGYPPNLIIAVLKSSLDNNPSLSISNALNAFFNSSVVSSSLIRLAINYTNSLKSTSPFPSASTSSIISYNSYGVGSAPNYFIMLPISPVDIDPLPSLSNNANASLNIYCYYVVTPAIINQIYIKIIHQSMKHPLVAFY